MLGSFLNISLPSVFYFVPKKTSFLIYSLQYSDLIQKGCYFYWIVIFHRVLVNILDIKTFTEDQLEAMIHKVIGNASYKEALSSAAAVYRPQPMTAIQRAVWWIEHVLEHGGRHYRTYALYMPWYQYLMLDISVVLMRHGPHRRGCGLPRQLHFKIFVCQNERIGTHRGGHVLGMPPLDPPM